MNTLNPSNPIEKSKNGKKKHFSPQDLTSGLNTVLEYKNPDIVNRFLDEFIMSENEAEMIFKDMKLWLYACANRPSKINMEISTSIVMIDEMWHIFVLHTRDYADFCQEMFGKFIHHAPFPSSTWKANKSNVEQQKTRDVAMTAQLEYLHELLGADVINRWYIEYPTKYSQEKMQSLMKDKAHSNELFPYVSELKEKGLVDKIQVISSREANYIYCGGPGCGATIN